MKRKLCLVLSAVTLIILGLVGCGQTSSDKIIRIGGTTVVSSSVDPAKDWEGWYTVRFGVGETLFKLDKDLVPQPWLAAKSEQRDPQTLVITLKDKLTFSNGEKVTPEKVIASLQRAGEMNSRATALKNATYAVEGNAVVIKTQQPYANLINDLTDPYAAIIDVANTKDFEKSPIGTGPFVMKSFEANKKAVMTKNAHYWGGEVKSDSVEYDNIADVNTTVMALQNGEIDIAQNLTQEGAATIDKNDKLVLDTTVSPRVYQVYFNLAKMPDKAVREAIMYGIDRKTMAEKTLKNSMTPTHSAFPANSVYNGKSLKVDDFNIEKAKAILASAGYKDNNGDGILEKDGKPLVVKLSIYKRLAMAAIATDMQAQLKKIGIDLEIVMHEKSTFFKPGDFEMGLYSIVTMPTGDPYAFLRDLFAANGFANYGKYENASIQEDLTELATTLAQDKRVALVQKIQQQAIDDAAVTYIGFNNILTGLSKSIKGYYTSPNDYYQVTKDLEKK